MLAIHRENNFLTSTRVFGKKSNISCGDKTEPRPAFEPSVFMESYVKTSIINRQRVKQFGSLINACVSVRVFKQFIRFKEWKYLLHLFYKHLTWKEAFEVRKYGAIHFLNLSKSDGGINGIGDRIFCRFKRFTWRVLF